MGRLILSVNPGSSSREYALFTDANKLVMSAYYEHDSDAKYSLTISSNHGDTTSNITEADFNNALGHFIDLYSQHKPFDTSTVSGVGVRVVMPGRRFLEHAMITDELYRYLQDNIQRAPLHVKTELEQIDQIRQTLPDVPIFAISDSEFHKTLSHEARNYAIPVTDADKHDIYRFGYHGISVQSVDYTMRRELNLNYKNTIICHLGSGASITALKNGQSIETSMGYSPLEGLVMATRSGNIDVEAALELKKRLNYTDDELTDYFNHRSGLLGLSETSNDIRELISAEENGDDQAKFALDSMVYRIRSYIGSYHAILGGLDAIVFTATVGERSSIIRQRICKGIEHLGVHLDRSANDSTSVEPHLINHPNSPIKVHVIPTNETAEIARQTAKMING